MRECVLSECKRRPQTVTLNSGIKMHRFPKEDFIRVKWISWVRDVCGHDSFNCKEFSALCNRHFEKSCFRDSGRLKPDSYPTITPEMLDAMERHGSAAEDELRSSSENHLNNGEQDIPNFEVEEIVLCEVDPLSFEGDNQWNESAFSDNATTSYAPVPANAAKTSFSCTSDPVEPNLSFTTPQPEPKAAGAESLTCTSTPLNPGALPRSRSSLPIPDFDPIPPNPARTKRKYFPGDLTEDDFSTPVKARRHFKVMKFALEKSMAKVLKLQKRHGVTIKKVEGLKFLSQRLTEDNLMSTEAHNKLEVAVDSILAFLRCYKTSVLRKKAPKGQAVRTKCKRSVRDEQSTAIPSNKNEM